MPFSIDGLADLVPLTGGTNHSGWLATMPDGSRVAVKLTPDMPADLFDTEAEGLRAIRGSGAIHAPEVIDVGVDFLVLEALRPAPGLDDETFWEETGRALAGLHQVGNERFGWTRDNWLGVVRQVNTPTVDCYEFFARHRLLRYLPEPKVQAVLNAQHRAGIERICDRLPELVPPSYPALTHGDLWPGNVMATAGGRPALIDPGVSWSWPEVDTSFMLCCGMPVPDRFFAAYHELRPAEPGWQDHLRLLHLRELLSVLAHGDQDWAVPKVVELVRRYG